ncbi:MAG: DnaJ domain-containing protein [Oscillospiraceae bacterium]|nr:DnaJ domain-containing protein [Oscillospiraceae bacterium]
MPIKDYYKVLGVEKTADATAVKTAYRKLAKDHHPDRNNGSKDAEQRFTEINEAYDVLGNEENRKKYDALVEQERTGRFHPQSGRASQGFEDGVDWDEILSAMFGWEGGSYAAGHSRNRGGFSGYSPEYSFEGFANGDPDDPFFGEGGVYTRVGGRGSLNVENTIQVSLKEAFAGAEKTIRIAGSEPVRFQIPAGAQPGERIRLEGMGGSDAKGNRGDRILKIELTAEPGLTLDGLNVTVEREISPWDAALGATLTLSPLKEELSVRVQAGARSGMKLRVRGQGYRDRSGRRGDLFVSLTIQNPSPLPEYVRAAYDKARNESR